MARVKAWKYNDPSAPKYPSDFEIVKKAVLQKTDLKNNNNKYYAIELHKAKGNQFRVFTHYGRTDDLDTNPNAGQKECRFFSSVTEAEDNYKKIYKQKTSKSKGYKELSLASSKIGSQKARGTSSGQVDDKTLNKIESPNGTKRKVKTSKLKAPLQAFVKYIYDEATNALTSTVNARITADGIETPLGILTLGQIEVGQKVLDEAYVVFKDSKATQSKKTSELERLSGDFYTAIPHRIGRSRKAIQEAVLDTLMEFNQKQELLQLMRDMLQVNGEGQNVLFNAEIDNQYDALNCGIDVLSSSSSEFKEIREHVLDSQIKSKGIKVKNVYTLKRPKEHQEFTNHIKNQRLLFHGSRIQNWVGILSRGILMPKIVVSMGVNRTDAGWLGNGIYFGDAACTSAFYTSAGRKGTRFMALARVALGKMRDYHKITYGIQAPPKGFDSCHGVRSKRGVRSDFADDEFVIYTTKQQRLEYLVEFSL